MPPGRVFINARRGRAGQLSSQLDAGVFDSELVPPFLRRTVKDSNSNSDDDDDDDGKGSGNGGPSSSSSSSSNSSKNGGGGTPSSTSSSSSSSPSSNSSSHNDGDGTNGGNSGNNGDSSNGENSNKGGDSNNDGEGDAANSSCANCIQDNNAGVYYTGSWMLNIQGLTGTTHSTTSAGSTASLSFNGSGIIVYGTIPQSNDTVAPPTAVYSIDAASPFVTTQPTANHQVEFQPLYGVSQLSADKQHTLTINVTKADSPYTLQFFVVSPNDDSDTVSVTSVATPTSSSGVDGPSTEISASSQKSFQILAAVFGVLLLLMFLAIGLFILVRRRRRGRNTRKSYSVQTRTESSKSLRGTIFTSTESILRDNPTITGSRLSFGSLPVSNKF